MTDILTARDQPVAASADELARAASAAALPDEAEGLPPAPAPAAPRRVSSLEIEVLAPLALGMLAVIAAVGTVAAAASRGGGSGLALASITALAGTALLAVVMRTLLKRVAGAPLEELRGAIQEIEEGNYDARMETVGVREFAHVAEGFNRMATIVGHQRERLKALAATDPLTELANHRHFHERLRAEMKRAELSRSPVAVVALNLDRFRELNEHCGTALGDEALQNAARALRKVVRTTDLVARFGSDDFAILLPGADPGYTREVADRARGAISRLTVQGRRLSASAGYACFPAQCEADANLAQLAAHALGVAKRAGGDSSTRYDADQAASLPTVRDQKAEILGLLSLPNPITPVFQPIVELATGRIAGYEALSRFNHEEQRSPDVWFNQANRCGLGAQLEAEAIRVALECPDRPANTYLSVNFSPSALTSRKVRAVLPKDLSSVIVEITEHELASEDGALEANLQMLRARGARIAVDDAGAGYAGLKQVMRVQPDIIKLDRSLIENVNADAAKAALIEFFVVFAGRTSAVVCTEGIETKAELSTLVDLNVTYGQGYVLAHPAGPWPSVEPSVGAALANGALRRHERPGGIGHTGVRGPVNRRLQRVGPAAPRSVVRAGRARERERATRWQRPA